MLTAFANGTLFGQRWGSDDASVLALHGWSGNAAQMKPSCGGFDAISLDLPGFGASVMPGEAWGASEYADAVEPVLDEFNHKAVVVGYSFGGRVAVHLGERHPEKIRALVLTGAPLLRRATQTKAPAGFRLMKWAARKGLVSDARMEQVRRNNGSADYRAASGVMRDILVRVVNETYETQLQNLRVPVYMVWGSNDTAAPPWIVEEVQSLVDAPVNVVMVDGADHWFAINAPQPLTDAIAQALREDSL